MSQYLLSIYQPDGVAPPPEQLSKVMTDMAALIQEARTANVWVFNGGLHPPSTATVARVTKGELLITDGPYTEGKEHIGGFIIIDVPDLDAALQWAGRLARVVTLPSDAAPTGLAIEVRPFRQ